jgi:hypothetical protein
MEDWKSILNRPPYLARLGIITYYYSDFKKYRNLDDPRHITSFE